MDVFSTAATQPFVLGVPQRTPAGALPRHLAPRAALSFRSDPRRWWSSHSSAGGVCAAAGGLAVAAAASRAARGSASWGRGRGPRTSAPRRALESDPLMPWRIPNTSSWQWLSVNELFIRERILQVWSFIDQDYANAIITVLLYLQSEDPKKPVQIYFSVPGAELGPALAVYDTICTLRDKGIQVTTLNYSLCAGMGAFLCAAGTPGRRFATPNAMFRMSRSGLESPFQGQVSDIVLEVRQKLKETARIEEEFSKLTKTPLDEIKKDLKRDFYLSAAEALDYGLCDRVLVPDYNKGKILTEGERDPWGGNVTKVNVAFGEFADPNQPRTAI